LLQDDKRPRIEEAGCSKHISDGALQKLKAFSASLQSKQTDTSCVDSASVSSQDVDTSCIKPPVLEKLRYMIQFQISQFYKNISIWLIY